MEGCDACGRTDNGRTECEDRARILDAEFAKRFADWPEGVRRPPQERTPLKPKLRIKITNTKG